MRRKSERTKEKEKSSPEKKSEKPTRRSRRHSRRSMRSSSISPERVDSGAEENETSTAKGNQEEAEEEHPTCVEETSSQVGAVITADPVSIPEVEDDAQTVATRSKKMKKHNSDSVCEEESQPPTSVTVDKEADESKSSDKGSRSPVWKVKCSDGGGGEIQKLKLCIVRPPETPEPSTKKKKRLSRNTSNQMREKSDVDDNDSNRGSQGEEDKLSSDERSVTSSHPNEQEESTKTDIKDGAQEVQMTEIEISQGTVEVDGAKDEEEKTDSPLQQEESCKNEENNEENDSLKDSVEENTEKVVCESSLTNIESQIDVNALPPSSRSPSCDVDSSKTGNVVSECDNEGIQVDSGMLSEDSTHPIDEIQNKSPVSSKEVLTCSSPNNEERNSPSNTQDTCEVSNEHKPIESSDTVQEPPVPLSEDTKVTPEENIELHDRSASSEDEKEVESGNSSPRFKHRSGDRTSRKDRSPDEYQQASSNNIVSGKHSRHLERRNHSPRRREKISLRRSFSGKSEESDDKTSGDQQSERERTDKNEDEKVEGQDIKSRRYSGVTDCSSGNVPRKRRWGQSNSSRPSKRPVLSISTHSLKTLIPGATLVPIGEVQLVQDEDVKKEKEVWDYEKDVDREKSKPELIENAQPDKKPSVSLSDAPRISVALTDDHESKVITRKISIVSDDARTLQKSPSPPRHRASNVLFITNLVRPFTVNQLRELLARTGKIVEGGFWIDKIKSKCYVEYESETEAKETRHALHGVRWPVSNPKTLCVDFGRKEDMEMAQAVAESDLIPRKTEPLKVERLDGWGAEPVREKEHEKNVRDHEREKEREYERERARAKERTYHAPMEAVEHHKKVAVREWDLGKLGQLSPERDSHYDEKIKDKEKKMRKEKPRHSRSISPHENPVRKVKKKEEDAPAKLLDDLFRKTKTTPCIYWLPLTAEQIVVKEEMRRKHMAEHERRMAEMRKAERERERVRAQQRQHRRVNEREKRRRRSGSASPKK